MIRIGISGTNWTRKTSTIRQVVELLKPQSVDVISLGSLVAKCPFPMGPKQTLDGSRWMVDRVAEILESTSDQIAIQIFDRTPLDIFAFTRHARKSAGYEDDKNAEDLLEQIQSLCAAFDAIFLCCSAEEWPLPETPSPAAFHFAQIIEDYLVQTATKWEPAVLSLPWQTAERVDRILKFVKA